MAESDSPPQQSRATNRRIEFADRPVATAAGEAGRDFSPNDGDSRSAAGGRGGRIGIDLGAAQRVAILDADYLGEPFDSAPPHSAHHRLSVSLRRGQTSSVGWKFEVGGFDR